MSHQSVTRPSYIHSYTKENYKITIDYEILNDIILITNLGSACYVCGFLISAIIAHHMLTSLCHFQPSPLLESLPGILIVIDWP